MGVTIPMILSGFAALLPVALIIVLQVYLCNSNQKWVGLILPVLSFIFGSYLFYIGSVNGFMSNYVRIGLFTLIFYLPCLILLILYFMLNQSKQNIVSQNLS